jgi:glycerol-3-phosphate dehydrogenase (NAD(P)+)
VYVLGAGSWGTAASLVLLANGHAVTLVARDPARAERIAEARENVDYLPAVKLPDALQITATPETLPVPDVLAFAVPSHAFRRSARTSAALWPHAPLLVSLTKGIDVQTLERMTDLVADAFPGAEERTATLAGPSHAEEVARDIPTAVVAASRSPATAAAVQTLFMRPSFRVYTNSDVVGVELAVALKNVIALAAGMSDGLGLGDNSKGALLTRGLAEITRVGVALGGRRETFFGLAGLGDLVTTCTSRHSRNRYVGEQIARGHSLEEVLGGMRQVAEGVRTTEAVHRLSRLHGLQTPIADQIYEVLFEGRSPREAIDALMTRDPRAED